MGKIRYKRHTYHTDAPKLEEDDIVSSLKVHSSEELPINHVNSSSMNVTFPKTANIFGNVSITPNMLKQQLVTAALPRFDQKMVGLSRCETRRAKEALKREKLSSMQVEFKEMLRANKKLKKKDRSPINSVFTVASTSVELKNALKRKTGVEDMDSLMDSLPSVNKALKESSNKRKPRTAKSSKRQDEEMLDDMNTFLNIMKNSTFATNPFSTISTHLKMKLESERQDT